MADIDVGENQAQWIRNVEGDAEEDDPAEKTATTDEVLEIQDRYRIWVKSPEAVPNERPAHYDRKGDPEGNHYYYEVPLETTTRINLDKTAQSRAAAITDALTNADDPDYPTRDDLDAADLSRKDLRLVDKARSNLLDDRTAFTGLHKTDTELLQDAATLTLLHLYKTITDHTATQRGLLAKLQAELGARGVNGVERVAKARRYIDDVADAPDNVNVQEGPQGGLYYDTDDTEVADDDDDNDEGEGDAARDATTLVDEMAVREWPDRFAHLSEDEVRGTVERVLDRYGESVATTTMAHLDGVEDKSPRGSAYSMTNHHIVLAADAHEETVVHELGHATLGAFGYVVSDVGNMPANLYAQQVPSFKFGEPVVETAETMVQNRLQSDAITDEVREQAFETLSDLRERYDGQTLRREDMHVGVPDEWDGGTPPEQMYDVAQAVNTAWERQIEADVKDETDAANYVIGKPYSACNAHETFALTHEVLQGGVADPTALETLYLRQQELLEAYTEVFEPRRVQQAMLNRLFDRFGPNTIWDELPYPDAEGTL